MGGLLGGPVKHSNKDPTNVIMVMFLSVLLLLLRLSTLTRAVIRAWVYLVLKGGFSI